MNKYHYYKTDAKGNKTTIAEIEAMSIIFADNELKEKFGIDPSKDSKINCQITFF